MHFGFYSAYLSVRKYVKLLPDLYDQRLSGLGGIVRTTWSCMMFIEGFLLNILSSRSNYFFLNLSKKASGGGCWVCLGMLTG